MDRRYLIAGLIVGLALLVGVGNVEAKKKRKPPKDVPTLMTERGKLLVQEEFAGEALPEQWKIAIGKWEIEEEALKGTEQAADEHAAVIRFDVDCTDAVIQFSFMFKGSKATGLSLNNKDGHVCRASLGATGLSVAKDKPKKDSDEEGQQIDAAKFEFKDGEWYDICVEILGKEMVASIGGDKKMMYVVSGEHEGVGKPKTNFAFYIGGVDQSVYFDDVRVWEAKPNDKWEKTKRKLEGIKNFMKEKSLR